MRLPGANCRTPLSTAVIAMLLVAMPHARAADEITTKPVSPDATLANLGLGKIPDGQRKFRPITIANLGNSNIRLFQALTNEKGFTLSGLDVSLTQAGGDRLGFSGVFAARSSSGASGSISLVSEVSNNAKPILTFAPRETGRNQELLTVDPATIDFGSVRVGSYEIQMGTLSASDQEVTISSANISNPEFTLGGLLFPFTIPAGGRQSYTVTFTPQSVGAVSATLSFLAYDGTSLTSQGLVGTGGDQSVHRVDLSWNASTSQDVIGYNVYRSTTSGGGYSKINSVLDTSTVYTDASVSDGNTYYYVATAVDSSGQESVYSNEVQAMIPACTNCSEIVQSPPRMDY
jgi:hypothetical protein